MVPGIGLQHGQPRISDNFEGKRHTSSFFTLESASHNALFFFCKIIANCVECGVDSRRSRKGVDMSSSSPVGFEVKSECSPSVTDKIVSGFVKELTEGLKRVEEVTLQGDDPYRLEASFAWIIISAKENNPENVKSIRYRINSSLFVKVGDGWREIPGYQESFGFSVPEKLDQNNQESIDEICESGVVYALARVFQVMNPE